MTWVHQDPVTKSQRFTNSAGALLSQRIDLDPWGNETGRTVDPTSPQQKPTHRFTMYERDANGSDEAMHRRYNSVRSRFEQPDPYEGSNDLTDPQSFNRYTYTQNDPVNFVDPSGLEESWNITGYCPPQRFFLASSRANNQGWDLIRLFIRTRVAYLNLPGR